MPLGVNDDDEDYVPSAGVEVVNTAPPLIISPALKSPIVDTRYTALDSLRIYVEGASQTVDYYSQILANSTENSSQAPSVGNIYQQYTKITGLEWKVTRPLEQTQNNETNEFSITGSATIYGGIIPNEGDMFTADVGDGRLGVFTLTEVDRKTILLNSVYDVTYTFTGLADDYRELLADLEEKTVKRDVFIASNLLLSGNVRIAESELVTLNSLKDSYSDLVGIYLGKFFDREFMTILQPETAALIYDPFLYKFFTEINDINSHPLLVKIRGWNVAEPGAINNTTIWDVLVDNQKALLSIATKEMWLVGTVAFNKWPYLKSIYHSRMDHVVYPKDLNPSAYDGISVNGLDSYERTITVPVTYAAVDIQAAPLVDTNGTLNLPPIIHSVRSHSHYVLSNAFYDQHPLGQSQLELMTWCYLKNQNLNISYLQAIIADVDNWSLLDKYYQLPVLLVLLRTAIKNFS